MAPKKPRRKIEHSEDSMKSKKGDTSVDIDDRLRVMGTQSNKRPMKKRPKPMLTFSSFARCNLFSLPKSCNSSSSSPSTNSFSEKNVNSQKKHSKKVEETESSSDDDYDDDDEEDEVEEETVQVDFEFFDPKPGDFHGVKLLLQRYLDNYQWDLSGFIDLILAQTTVGTVVKSADSEEDADDSDGDKEEADEEELFAVITALNLGRYQDNQCIKELKQYLLGVCKEESTKVKLRQVLEKDARDAGLLVCQRFANCPYQVVLKLYEALFDEISWATEDEPTQVLCDSFRFKHYLVITKILENKGPLLQKAVKRKADWVEPVIYMKQEDEILHEMSSWSFTFELSAEELAPPEFKGYKKLGLVMLIKAEAIAKFLKKLKSLVEML
ncbi:Protein BCCIP [Rhynchospora pubera]|uniref:Protein BCCIP n=1 Tax=Rhynchospora pubera TaxID=906938 RepID=A0AAV8E2H3_9POAL|nr:Protein BCCIP [Rhynchospora pubera]